MELLAVLSILGFVVVVFPLLVLFQAWLLTVVARGAVGVEITFGAAVFTVVVAGLAQTCCTPVLAGVDGGIGGSIVGFILYSAMLSLVNGLDFGKAVVIAVVMAFVQWVLVVGLFLVLVATGLAAAIGLGALASL